MITVKVEQEKEHIKKVQISGHAMYDIYGKDIVCSAVSSIATTTVNACLSFDEQSIQYKTSQKGLCIQAIKQDTITQTLIRNMLRMLKELEQTYKENIVVK